MEGKYLHVCFAYPVGWSKSAGLPPYSSCHPQPTATQAGEDFACFDDHGDTLIFCGMFYFGWVRRNTIWDGAAYSIGRAALIGEGSF
jgi:hypothetical protein